MRPRRRTSLGRSTKGASSGSHPVGVPIRRSCSRACIRWWRGLPAWCGSARGWWGLGDWGWGGVVQPRYMGDTLVRAHG